MLDFINPWAYARKAREKREQERQRLDQIKRDALEQRLKNIAAAEQKRRKEAYEQHLTVVRSESGLTAKKAADADIARQQELARRSREDDDERARRTRDDYARNQQDDMLTYGPFSASAPGHAPSHAPSTHCAPSDTASYSPSSSDSSCSTSSDSSGGSSGD